MPDRIKVAHVITRLDRGGSAENTFLTALAHDPARYDVTVIAGSQDLDPSKRERLQAQEKRVALVENLVRAVNPRRDLGAFLELRRLLGDGNYDVIHTHTSKAGFLGRMAAPRSSAIVHTPHGHVFYGYYGWILTRGFILAERLAARRTDRIVTLTDMEAADHVRLRIAPRERFVTIPSGIDVARYAQPSRSRREVRAEIGIQPDVFLVGAVGRLVPIKGHRHLIEAMARLERAALVVAGDGSLREELSELVGRLNLSGRVKLLGEREDIPGILGALDLFALPSLNEGQSRALAEAMAAGLPAVASRVGGVPEVLVEGLTGLLVGPADPGGLAEAIEKLMADADRRATMGQAARRRAADVFSIRRMIERIEALYGELLAGKRKG